MAAELGSQDGPSATGTIAFTRRTGPNSPSCGAKAHQALLLPPHPRCNVPRLGEPWFSSRPGTAGGPVDVSFCPPGLHARRRWRGARLDSAGLIVVELVLVDRLGGPPVEGHPWDVTTGLRLVQVPAFGGLPRPEWRLG